MSEYRVVEICAGAGGQSLGLELAGFGHDLSVELDPNAAATLRHNRPHWKVAVGDVASPAVWNPADYACVDLLAGGVPCPPFTIAGKQLGATDERDLFAWAIELCGTMRPRALLLENVRGLSFPSWMAICGLIWRGPWRSLGLLPVPSLGGSTGKDLSGAPFRNHARACTGCTGRYPSCRLGWMSTRGVSAGGQLSGCPREYVQAGPCPCWSAFPVGRGE